MSFSRRIGRVALDHKPGALLAVGDEAIAENEALAGFQLDLETHCVPFSCGSLLGLTRRRTICLRPVRRV